MKTKAQSFNEDAIWTAANIVTLIRIAFIPLFYLCATTAWTQLFTPSLTPWLPYINAGFFVLLSITDTIDGYLARSRGEVSTFGKFIDPIADKILVASALLILVGNGQLASWVALIIIVREFIISGLRMIAANQGKVIPASWYGKWKTIVTMIALTLYLFKDAQVGFTRLEQLWFLPKISQVIMTLAVILTVLSCLDYFKHSWILLFKGVPSTSRSSIAHPISSSVAADTSLEDLRLEAYQQAEQLITKVSDKNLRISCAESCTGGMLCAFLTSVSGASKVIEESIVSYSDKVKQARLDVSPELLSSKGAVSAEVAREMVLGQFRRSGADLVLSITGLAGPGLDEFGHPVGTVFIGCAYAGDKIANRVQNLAQEMHPVIQVEPYVQVDSQLFEGSREEVRLKSCIAALRLAYEVLKDKDLL